jgi:hypothetical protein
VTARTDGFLRGRPDLADVIERLRAFERAGADVLFAPGLPDLAAVGAVSAAVSKPVSFMAGIPGRSFTAPELAADQPRHLPLSRRDERHGRGRPRGPGQGHLRLRRPHVEHSGAERLHAGLRDPVTSRA